MQYVKLQIIEGERNLFDAMVTSADGTKYIVQIFDSRGRAGFEAVIQKVGRPECKPLFGYYLNRETALGAINMILKRIGVQVEI